MSTFAGTAWLELAPGADPGPVLDALGELQPRLSGARIEVTCAEDTYGDLGQLVSSVMRDHPPVRCAVIALEHDEFGAEFAVLAPVGGVPHRVQHVYFYPRDADGALLTEVTPALSGLPPAAPEPPPGADPGALLDDPGARASVAGLFGVPIERLDAAVTREGLTPLLQALGLHCFEAWQVENDWFLCVRLREDTGLRAVVQFLPVAAEHLVTDVSERGADPAAFFAAQATLTAVIERASAAADRDPDDACAWETLCYARLLSNDLQGAHAAADRALEAASACDSDALADRVGSVKADLGHDPAKARKRLEFHAYVTLRALGLTG